MAAVGADMVVAVCAEAAAVCVVVAAECAVAEAGGKTS